MKYRQSKCLPKTNSTSSKNPSMNQMYMSQLKMQKNFNLFKNKVPPVNFFKLTLAKLNANAKQNMEKHLNFC